MRSARVSCKPEEEVRETVGLPVPEKSHTQHPHPALTTFTLQAQVCRVGRQQSRTGNTIQATPSTALVLLTVRFSPTLGGPAGAAQVEDTHPSLQIVLACLCPAGPQLSLQFVWVGEESFSNEHTSPGSACDLCEDRRNKTGGKNSHFLGRRLGREQELLGAPNTLKRLIFSDYA